MSQPDTGEPTRRQKLLNLTLAGVAAQVGCITLIIVLAAVFGGIWLDGHFDTRPWFTIGLLVISVPISLLAMFVIVRAAVSKIKTGSQKMQTASSKEETGFGNNS
jgi:F0F1-type ATP synthase assembly protein I